MKIKNLHLSLLVICLVVFSVSCKKDKNNDKNELKEKISAKWAVSGSSNYESFEFNESGNYVIVVNDTQTSSVQTSATNSSVLFGTYEVVAGDQIKLNNFGTLTIISIEGDKKINFSITTTSNPSAKVSVTGVKQAEMASSSRTELLCRTWEMISIDGISVKGTDYNIAVLFSKAGTYFVEDSGLAQWSWKDATEKKMCYSWDGTADCTDGNEVEIVELTTRKLVIEEYIFGEKYTYVLEPIDNSNRLAAKNAKQTLSTGAEIKSGFFKK